jgi:methionine sulfoxide reductase catalytic subunit
MEKSKFKSVPVQNWEITPEHIYLSRRQFIQSLGILGAGALLVSCAPKVATLTPAASVGTTPQAQAGFDELGDPLNTYQEITNYNNFYEFTTVKQEVAELARNFVPNSGDGKLPYTLQVGGLVNRPTTFGMEDLLNKFNAEERIYRLRCVEGWSMVIPWIGFRLADLLKTVEPLSKAKFVRFETMYDPEQMPGQRRKTYPWPYQEGLRLDEAMHDLTILATGLYGKPLPGQSGMPIRLVVPWKYGFKSIKSIVKIELVEQQPETLWNTIAPEEYGFYSNVNPEVDHPRWSQKTERRIGESGRRKTLLFNGYAEEVAGLYEGTDLWVNF